MVKLILTKGRTYVYEGKTYHKGVPAEVPSEKAAEHLLESGHFIIDKASVIKATPKAKTPKKPTVKMVVDDEPTIKKAQDGDEDSVVENDTLPNFTAKQQVIDYVSEYYPDHLGEFNKDMKMKELRDALEVVVQSVQEQEDDSDDDEETVEDPTTEVAVKI